MQNYDSPKVQSPVQEAISRTFAMLEDLPPEAQNSVIIEVKDAICARRRNEIVSLEEQVARLYKSLQDFDHDTPVPMPTSRYEKG